MCKWFYEWIRVYVSLNAELSFSILQCQISACIPPHSKLYRYCTSNMAKIHTNAVWQDLEFTFQYKFFLEVFRFNTIFQKSYMTNFRKRMLAIFPWPIILKSVLTYLVISVMFSSISNSAKPVFDTSYGSFL